jgi:hypothetical protein
MTPELLTLGDLIGQLQINHERYLDSGSVEYKTAWLKAIADWALEVNRECVAEIVKINEPGYEFKKNLEEGE